MDKFTYNFTPLSEDIPVKRVVQYSIDNYFKGPIVKVAFGLLMSVVSVFFMVLIYLTISEPSFGIAFIFPIAGITALGVYFFVKSTRQKIRVTDFADKNQLEYISGPVKKDREGLIFNEGHSRNISEGFRAKNHDFMEIGNYTYITGSGKNSQTHRYGFISISLPRRLPHILLDSVKNNYMGFMSNLPGYLRNNQKLMLEGNFNDYFTLYVPEGYGRDALYVLTPDIMRMFIEQAEEYDIEIVDDVLYVYTSGSFDLANQASLEKLFAMAAKIKAEIHHQTDYYADERIGNRGVNVVSRQGQRLKKFSTTKIVLYIVLSFILIQGLIQVFIVMSALNTG